MTTRQNPTGFQFPKVLVVTIHTANFNTQTFHVLTTRCVCVCVQYGSRNISSCSATLNKKHFSTQRSYLQFKLFWTHYGRDSSVGVATCYGLDGPVIFSAPVQTGPGAHPTSYTLGTGSFPGVKRPGRGADHPLPSSTEVTERVELYFYFPSGPSWPVLGWTFTFNISSVFQYSVADTCSS